MRWASPTARKHGFGRGAVGCWIAEGRIADTKAHLHLHSREHGAHSDGRGAVRCGAAWHGVVWRGVLRLDFHVVSRACLFVHSYGCAEALHFGVCSPHVCVVHSDLQRLVTCTQPVHNSSTAQF